MWELFIVTPSEIVATVASTAVMYLAMVVLVRLLGQRVIASMSSFDVAAVIAFGAIIGRAALGDHPRLMSGIVALCTLVLMQAIVGAFRATRTGARVAAVQPVLLMVHGRPIPENLKRCHVSDAELRSRLRQAGVRDPAEVSAVVFEPSGGTSVIRVGEPIAASLMEGVAGAERLS